MTRVRFPALPLIGVLCGLTGLLVAVLTGDLPYGMANVVVAIWAYIAGSDQRRLMEMSLDIERRERSAS